MGFDHERLDVYQASLTLVGWVTRLHRQIGRAHGYAKDQLTRSAISIPLNIAEGNGKRSSPDRKRFFEIARGSAMESAATLDVMVAVGACPAEDIVEGKQYLMRIVSMLSRMTEQCRDRVGEEAASYEVSDGMEWDEKSRE